MNQLYDTEEMVGDDIYVATTEPIKGMAIDVNLLGEDEKRWLESFGKHIIMQALQNRNQRFIYFVLGKLQYHEMQNLSANGYTITTNPTEFMEYVSQQTGKEYKVEREETVDEAIERLGLPVYEIYPHKTYRILDSLDSIPLDKRIPLSEWIPPYEAEVNFISDNNFDRGSFVKLDKHGIIVKYRNIETIFPLDGHWMRIV